MGTAKVDLHSDQTALLLLYSVGLPELFAVLGYPGVGGSFGTVVNHLYPELSELTLGVGRES